MNKKYILILLLILLIALICYYYLSKENIKEAIFTPQINRLMKGFTFNFLSSSECDFIIKEAEKNEWTKKRHKYYPTIDQEVKNIPTLNFLFDRIKNKINPVIEQKYGFKKYKLNDFFVVKYDTGKNGMNKLDIHRDTSVLNFIVTLNNTDEFEGGGTIYPEFNKTFKPDKGQVFLSSGKLKHGGAVITKGKRYILIGFIDIFDDNINHKYLKTIEFKLPTPDLLVMSNIFYKKLDIYIINLKKRTDRKAHLLGLLNSLYIPDGFKLNINVIEANTGENGVAYKYWKTNEKYKNLPESVYKYWKRDIKKSEIGCFNSHIGIIRTINNKNNDENTINLILEDDVNFSINFLHELKEIYSELVINDTNWDICFLGRNKLSNNKSLSKNIEQTGYSYNAHCYIISNKCSKIISNINLDKKIIPYDEFIPCLSWDHPRNSLNKLYLKQKNKIASYSSKKNLSFQKGFGYSDIN